MKASIATHGLLENLVVRVDGPADAGTYVVVAGGRRLAAMKALADAGTIDADHLYRRLFDDGFPGLFRASEAWISHIVRALPDR